MAQPRDGKARYPASSRGGNFRCMARCISTVARLILGSTTAVFGHGTVLPKRPAPCEDGNSRRDAQKDETACCHARSPLHLGFRLSDLDNPRAILTRRLSIVKLNLCKFLYSRPASS